MGAANVPSSERSHLILVFQKYILKVILIRVENEIYLKFILIKICDINIPPQCCLPVSLNSIN